MFELQGAGRLDGRDGGGADDNHLVDNDDHDIDHEYAADHGRAGGATGTSSSRQLRTAPDRTAELPAADGIPGLPAAVLTRPRLTPRRLAVRRLAVRRLAVALAAGMVFASPVVGTPASASATTASPSSPASPAPSTPGPAAPGFWLATDDGSVTAFGAAQAFGSHTLASESTICMASTADGNGYWLLGARGTLTALGDAAMRGGADSTTLARPIVGIASTADDKGYWEVATDGGIFNYGDAAFLGSAASLRLNQPIVGMAPTPDGGGYWLVAADGGIFNYGDARFLGSAGALPLAQPIVGMAASATGNGYWLVAADGGVFAYGDALFHGSAGSVHLAAPVIGMTRTPSGNGYWLAANDGGTFNYGDAPFIGSLAGKGSHQPVVAISAPGQGGGCLGAAVPANLVTVGPGGPDGEGVWTPAARRAGSTAAIYTTTFRPYPGGAPAGIAWIDTDRTVLRLYAGPPSEPPGTYTYSAVVQTADRPDLLAGFNSGFRVNQSNGGWFSEHQNPIPLVNGSASLVIYANRTVKLGVWARDVTLTPDVASVRQNLTPLIDRGHVASDINNGFDWGPVLGGIGNTWRSGLGIDATGHLLFVAGPGLYPADLANVLAAAGAVEAMELDINPLWPLFATYASPPGQPPSTVSGTKLLPGMSFAADHYLAPTDRDFFAVFSR